MLLPLLLALSPVAAASPASPPFVDLTADAGGPYDVTAGETVLLDASGSITFQCVEVEFSWDIDGDREVDIEAGSEPTWTLDTSTIDGPVVWDVTLYMHCWLVDAVDSIRRADETTLTVENAPPEITMVGWDPAEVDEGGSLRLEVDYDEPEPADAVTITWELDDGRVFDGTKVVVPMVQDGTVEVVVRVEDDDGDADTDTFWVDVLNLPPELVGSPPLTVAVGQAWSFAPTVEDPGAEDEHRFSADLPPGATLDDKTGALSWIPTEDQVGEWDFTLVVRDEDAAEDRMVFSVTVTAESEDPPVTRPDGNGSADGDPYADAYPVAGEGCDCGSGSAALLLLPLLGLRRRR